jgi:hypothetical protein
MATVRVRIAILTVRIILSVCPFNRMAHTANSRYVALLHLHFVLFCFTCILTTRDFSVVIEVNVERSELNGGEVLVYLTNSIPGIGGKAHYHGFSLLL